MKRLLPLVALAAFFAFPVMASPSCDTVSSLVVQLVEEYGEQIIDTVPVEKDGRTFYWSFWASPSTNSWTVTLREHGSAGMCAITWGDDYHDIDFRAWVSDIMGEV